MATGLDGRGTQLPELGVATLRIGIGLLIATLHGWHKVVDGWHYAASGTEWPLLDDTIAIGFPLPFVFATAAALSQFVGGCLLVMGLATRTAALFVTCTLVTAVAFNVQSSGPDVQLAAVYALVSGAFVLIGGGRYSVDRLQTTGGGLHTIVQWNATRNECSNRIRSSASRWSKPSQ